MTFGVDGRLDVPSQERLLAKEGESEQTGPLASVSSDFNYSYSYPATRGSPARGTVDSYSYTTAPIQRKAQQPVSLDGAGEGVGGLSPEGCSPSSVERGFNTAHDAERPANVSAANSAAAREPVIQRVMDHDELDKLQAVLQKYVGTIDDETLEEIWNRFGVDYDTLEEATPALEAALRFIQLQTQTHVFRVNATAYPRVYLAGDDPLTRENLVEKLEEGKQPPKGFDLSYRQHVDLIDAEMDQFLPEGDFDQGEQRDLYSQAVSESLASSIPRKRAGMFTLEAPGGLPLTAITPDLMHHYHRMHYTHVLKRPDETQSTRTYEDQYLSKASESLNFESFRAFILPPGTDVGPDQESMVNTLGATLDTNTPTRGNTIGAGKINSMVYLHFRRSLELLNADLDQGALQDRQDDFEQRTRAHVQSLHAYGLKGMLANEEERALKGESSVSWEILQPMIMEAAQRIIGMMNALGREEELPEFEINPMEEHLLEKLRVLGVVLGLMIKVDKRVLINRVMIDMGSEEDVVQILTNLKNLSLVERNINAALAKHQQ